MDNNQTKYLQGKCLAAVPTMEDERFLQTLIYVCAHSENGAMGFVINKKMPDFSFMDLAMQLPIKRCSSLPPLALYQGGPIEKARGFVLHSTDYLRDDCMDTGGGVAISASIDILSDIACGTGPKENIIALGYANWGAGQLEKEIIFNNWLVTPSNEDLVFKTKDEDKWQKAIDEIGIDLCRLSTSCGRA